MPKRTSGPRRAALPAGAPELRLEIVYRAPRSLKLWDENPRRNDAAAKKLVSLIEEHGFGQPVTVRAEDGIVYKGNTRVKAAILIGMDSIPVMERSYPDRQDAVDDAIADNQAATFSSVDEDKLVDALGKRDKVTLARRTGFDVAEVGALLEGWKLPENDPTAEWEGMPEYEHEDQTSFRRVVVHFKRQEDVDRFAERIGQRFTDKTRSVWFPKAEIGTIADKRYGE